MDKNADTSLEPWGNLAPLGLPRQVHFCKRCVVSNQKPISAVESGHSKNDLKSTINFSEGVCDACLWAERKSSSVDWYERELQLEALCGRHRKNNGSYDVIVPASGGKDSRYVAHILKTRYRMNPLTVTWKPHKFTQVGFENLMGLIECGFANIMYSPAGDVQRRLTALAFENIGHPFQPFIIGQRVVGVKAALEYDVSLVFYGENVAEYGNRIEDNYSPLMDAELYTCFNFDENTLDRYLIAGKSLRDLVDFHGFSMGDLMPYKSPSKSEVEEAGIEVHYMSYYRKWVPQDNYYYAVEHTGFKSNEKRKDGSYSKYSGIDDVIEDLHYYMQLIKFGMGRCTWDAAQEVRTGRLERDEAVALVAKYDQEPLTENFSAILDYLSISEDKFWTVINSFRPRHLWNLYDDGKFSLKYPVR